jgi:Contractile injection system tube protein
MERAAFLIQDPERRSTIARLSCLLNPNTLTFRRVAGLRRRRSLGGAVTQDRLRDDPLLQTGGGVTELRLDLLFDVNVPGTWLESAPADSASGEDDERDVRDLTRPLWDLAENQKRPGLVAGPPRVRFVWGKRWDFPAVVAAVAERLENFSSQGVPQRSFLRLCLLRAADDVQPEQLATPPSPGLPVLEAEPESGSPLDVLPAAEQPPPETYESYLSPGQPLFLTAFLFFGDASLWSAIAEANPDVDPVFVPPGTALRIPAGGKVGAM